MDDAPSTEYGSFSSKRLLRIWPKAASDVRVLTARSPGHHKIVTPLDVGHSYRPRLVRVV